MRRNVTRIGKIVRLTIAGGLALATRRRKMPLLLQLGLTAVAVEAFLAGVTGYCPVNQALGIAPSTDRAELSH